MKTYSKPFVLLFALVAVLGLPPSGRAIITGEVMQITGYVRNDLGGPVAGVDVTGDDYVGDFYPSTTDANGYYSVDLKTEGNYQVTVNCAQLTELGYGCVNPGAVTMTRGSAQLDFLVHPAAPPLQITNTFLPDAVAGAVYQTQLGAKGGRAPYKWQFAVDSTNLPAGLVLNSRGHLFGKPETNGVSLIIVQVTDANVTVTNKVFSIAINPGPLPGTPASPPPDSPAK